MSIMEHLVRLGITTVLGADQDMVIYIMIVSHWMLVPMMYLVQVDAMH